ncbi:MAG: ABC transporter substrate-binding protein [Clostridia bacterium]|nr:ABC transporter substrate-binding protein [Clostridia bacterium]
MKRSLITRAVTCMLTAILSVLFLVCGCTENNSSNQISETTQEDDCYPLELTDFYGQTVTVESEPQRVISASPVITEIIFELGMEDRLVGRTDYCDYPDNVSDITSIGAIDSPSIETIIELNPDVIIASSILSEENYDKLTELGYPVLIARDETSFEGMFTNIETVAKILNCNDKAEELEQSLRDRISKIEPITKNVSVYYCVGFGEYGEYAATGDTYINEMIEMTGAKNAAADAEYWTFSTEALIEADPDYILLPEWAYNDFIITEPYSELSAVKNNQVIVVDPNIFERQTARNVDAIEMLYEIVSK